MEADIKRSRTFEWENPMKGAKAAMQMPGLEYLQSIGDSHFPLPPLMYTLDFTVTHLEKGKVSFAFIPQEFHYNPIGSVHGGVISAILDSAMGCTLHSILPVGTGYTTLELKVNFLKTVTIATGKMEATGKIIHSGKSTALVEAQLTDEKGTVYAHGTSTCLLIKFEDKNR